MCKLFSSICKPRNLGDSEEFLQGSLCPSPHLIFTGLFHSHSWFNQWMSLFRVKIKFTWFAPVYTPMPPDVVLLYICRNFLLTGLGDSMEIPKQLIWRLSKIFLSNIVQHDPTFRQQRWSLLCRRSPVDSNIGITGRDKNKKLEN
jgi:hypothetical protein